MKNLMKALVVVAYLLAVGILAGWAAMRIGHQPIGFLVVIVISVFVHIFAVNITEAWFFSDIGDMTDRLHPIGARTWIMGFCCSGLIVVTFIIQIIYVLRASL